MSITLSEILLNQKLIPSLKGSAIASSAAALAVSERTDRNFNFGHTPNCTPTTTIFSNFRPDRANSARGVATPYEKIDAVINNAGRGVLGLQEGFTTEQWKQIFDVNVFGVQRVCRAILPHFKANHSGLILNISSLLGRIAVPFYGPYNASKWALESLSENYRYELSPLGIEVCVVEPGGYPTSFIEALVKPNDSPKDAAYLGQTADQFLEGFEKALASNPAQDPKQVAEAIVALIEMEPGSRPLRTIADKVGMGDHIKSYNEKLAQLTSGIYGAFGISHLLTLKKI